MSTEVPADEGTLRERLAQAIHVYWHGPVCTNDDQPQSEHYKEADALLPSLATERSYDEQWAVVHGVDPHLALVTEAREFLGAECQAFTCGDVPVRAA